MVYRGTIRSGVVVLPEDVALPEGTEVLVTLTETQPEPMAGPTIWKTLTELGRWAETLPTDLPPDLAANHDHHIHGLPKRR